MPCNTQKEAREVIYDMLLEALGADVHIQYQGINEAQDPDPNKPFVRISITYTSGEQYSLANSFGKRHYNKKGIIAVQSFGPLSNRGFSESERLAELAENCYRGKTGAGGIWFRDIKSTPIGPSSAWYQHNTTIEFQYSQYRG